MARKKPKAKKRPAPIKLDDITQGAFKVPYFNFRHSGYVGVAALVTDGNSDFGQPMEASGLLDPTMIDRWDRLYSREQFGYDVTLVGVRRGQYDAVQKKIGEFSRTEPNEGAGPGLNLDYLTSRGADLSATGRRLLERIVMKVSQDPHEYQMTRRVA